MLPWTQRAYETRLSAGSTAMLSTNQQNGAPTRNCTGLACLPSRCLADNALVASQMVGARLLARPRLPGSEPGGSAIPREPRAEKLVSLTGFAPVISCLRGRRVGWTTLQGQKWWERRVLPSLPLACQTSALLMSYAPRNIGAGERNRTVVSTLAQPHSAVEPHPQNWCPQPGSHRQHDA